MLFSIKIDCIFTSLKISSFCQKKKKIYFCACNQVSQSLKNHIAFLYNNENFKKIYIYFIMHFSFNNQFIKVMKTLANILKKLKKIFCFVLI